MITRTQIPNEIISVVKRKREVEQMEVVTNCFETCIIPYIYMRERAKEELPPIREESVSVTQVGNQWSKEVPRYTTSFTLTALKRVCSRMAKEVSLGNDKDYDTYAICFYVDNHKLKPLSNFALLKV